MYLPLTVRIRRARHNATCYREQRLDSAPSYSVISEELILSRLGTKLVVDNSEGIIVTEAGFITMAVFASDARYCQGLMVIPGIDDRKQFGYLVVREGHVPFHSLSASIGRAAVDSQRAWEQSSQLVQHFGGKSGLKKAAESAPWYLRCKMEDTSTAGLCQWGVDSFLRRLCLRRISKWIGLPQIVLRLAGAYGCRITAAALVRHEQQ